MTCKDLSFDNKYNADFDVLKRLFCDGEWRKIIQVNNLFVIRFIKFETLFSVCYRNIRVYALKYILFFNHLHKKNKLTYNYYLFCKVKSSKKH